MRKWLTSLTQPGLPSQWQRVTPTHYQLRQGDEAIHVQVRQLSATRRATARAHAQGIVVCVPPRANIHNALQSFEPWIQSQWSAIVAHTRPLLIPFATRTLPLFGRELDVRWETHRRLAMHVDNDVLVIQAPATVSTAQIGRLLKQFYEAQARNQLSPLLNRLMEGLPSTPSRIRFARVKSIWGSMNSKGVLTLERSLAIAPAYVFEYLVVHELCHLLEMNHSRAFWSHVAKRCPDYKQAEAYLHSHGNILRMDFDRITDADRFIWKENLG